MGGNALQAKCERKVMEEFVEEEASSKPPKQ